MATLPQPLPADLEPMWLTNWRDSTLLAYDPVLLEQVASLALDGMPLDAAVGEGGLWVLDSARSRLLRLDPANLGLVADIPRVPYQVSALAVGLGGVWVGVQQPGIEAGRPAVAGLLRVDPLTNTPGELVQIGAPAVDFSIADGRLWLVASREGFSALASLDPGTLALDYLDRYGTWYDLSVATADAGSLWVANTYNGAKLYRLDAQSGDLLATIEIEGAAGKPYDLAVAAGSVWLLFDDGMLAHIDPQREEVLALFPVSNRGGSLRVGEGQLWVLSQYDGAIYRIDPYDNRVSMLVATGGRVPTPTPAPTATAYALEPPRLPCQGAYETRLKVGMTASVVREPPIPNRMRSEPRVGADAVGLLQPGEKMTILKGPECVDDWIWWQVQSLSTGLVGWTAEGDQDAYWLEPE
jgi:streptogramin lyase